MFRIILRLTRLATPALDAVTPRSDRPIEDTPHSYWLRFCGGCGSDLRSESGAPDVAVTMAHVLFTDLCSNCTHPDFSPLDRKIRLSIFLLAGECGGLPALLWSLRVLHHHHISGHRVSAFIILLLLNDVLELLLSPYVAAEMVHGEARWDTSTTCRVLSSLWGMSRTCGLHLQQVESALSHRRVLCCTRGFFPACSIVVYVLASVCVFLCEFFSLPSLFLLSAFLTVAMVITSWTVIVRATAAAKLHRLKRPDLTVLDIATFMMVLSSLWVVFWLDLRNLWVLWMMCSCLMSLRVISDPLLCVLVCRENLRLQSPRTVFRAAQRPVIAERRVLT